MYGENHGNSLESGGIQNRAESYAENQKRAVGWKVENAILSTGNRKLKNIIRR